MADSTGELEQRQPGHRRQGDNRRTKCAVGNWSIVGDCCLITLCLTVAKSQRKPFTKYRITIDSCIRVLPLSCFMYPRKKAGADPLWNCDELPPGDLLKSLHLERAAINQDEFARAEWFWNRRPKILCENWMFFLCYIVVFVCLVYLVPESIPLLLVWMVAGISCAFVDGVRLDRWRNEYRSSIKRAREPL